MEVTGASCLRPMANAVGRVIRLIKKSSILLDIGKTWLCRYIIEGDIICSNEYESRKEIATHCKTRG